jgi:hypothetical protein
MEFYLRPLRTLKLKEVKSLKTQILLFKNVINIHSSQQAGKTYRSDCEQSSMRLQSFLTEDLKELLRKENFFRCRFNAQ